MTSQFLFRCGGLSAILAGGMTILLTIPNLFLEDVWLHFLQVALLLLGITSIYLFQYQEAGVVGLLGFLLAFIGTMLFLVSESVAGIDSLALGGIISGIGIILLAIASWKSGKLPRWIPALWIMGSVIGIPGTFLVSPESYLLLISAGFFAIGFVAAGIILLRAA